MKKKLVFILTLAIIMLFPTLNPSASTAKINLKETSNGSINTTLHFEDGFVGGFDLVFKVSDNVKVKNVAFNSDYAKNKFTAKYSYDSVNHTLRIIVTTGGIGSNHNLLNKNRELSLGNINLETTSKTSVQYTLEKVSLSYNDNNWQLKKIASNDLTLGTDNKFTLVVKEETPTPPKEEETTPPKEEDDDKENQGGTTGGNTGSDNDKEDKENQGSTGNTPSGDKEEENKPSEGENQGGTSSGSTSESKPSTTPSTGSGSTSSQTKPNQNNGTTSNKTETTTPNTGNVGDGKVDSDTELPSDDADTDIDSDPEDDNNITDDTTTNDTDKKEESGNKLTLIITVVAIAIVVGILLMVYFATKTKKPIDF